MSSLSNCCYFYTFLHYSLCLSWQGCFCAAIISTHPELAKLCRSRTAVWCSGLPTCIFGCQCVARCSEQLYSHITCGNYSVISLTLVKWTHSLIVSYWAFNNHCHTVSHSAPSSLSFINLQLRCHSVLPFYSFQIRDIFCQRNNDYVGRLRRESRPSLKVTYSPLALTSCPSLNSSPSNLPLSITIRINQPAYFSLVVERLPIWMEDSPLCA